MYFTLSKDSSGEWRWKLKAGNHETIAVSSEGYVRKVDCKHSINLVKSTDDDTPVHEF